MANKEDLSLSALSDLYSYAQEEHIGIYAYPIEFRAAVSMRDGPRRATFFDFAKLTTTADICWAAAHENGHHHMGAYHKVDSPYQVWGQAEYRANHWAFEHYLSPAQLLEAFEAGYTEAWQIAEWFNLPEDAVKKALHYWTECRGVIFNKFINKAV
mgnify:CR=1 FL=1